jgi:hypothetical protein
MNALGRLTYNDRNVEFDRLNDIHKKYLGQITIHTKPEKVMGRVSELREFVKNVERVGQLISYDRYCEADRKYKKCAEIIAHWKTLVKIITGVSL